MKHDMTPAAYIAHIKRLAGRFERVDETDSALIVGLLGRLEYDDLTTVQADYIATFYDLPGHNVALLPGYHARRNDSIYSAFIAIAK